MTSAFCWRWRGEGSILSSYSVQASHCVASLVEHGSRVWAQSCVLGSGATGSIAEAHRFSCSVACGIFLEQGSCIGRQILLSHHGSLFFFFLRWTIK